MSYASVAQFLDCSTKTVRRLVAKRLLDSPRNYSGIGPRFTEADVLLYLARHSESSGLRPDRTREGVSR